jgi:polysaccharide pyruvyl transferase WcaK-like protein
MRIVLADCYHDSDKGGGGIVAGALRAIEAVCARRGVEADIALMYRFSADDPRFASAARLTRREFPDYPVLPAPISSRRGPGLAWLPWAVRALGAAPLRLLAPRWSRHPSVRALRVADAVVFKGGHFYRSWRRNPVLDAGALFLLTYPVLLATRLGRRCALVSHSFGPFQSAAARRMIRRVLSRADYVSCRERHSRDILLACGLRPEQVAVTPDTGFGAYPADAARTEELLARYALTPGRYAAVTARPWFFTRGGRDEAKYRRYIVGMAALCDYLAEAKVARVALVVQNDGAHSRREPDLGPLRDIQAAMARRASAVLVDDDLSFRDLTALYGGALLTLGVRMHSCIFSLAAGTPALAVAYGHKSRGIMEMAGAERFVLDVADLSADEGRRLIDEIVAQRDALSARFRARVAELRAGIEAAMERALFGGPS